MKLNTKLHSELLKEPFKPTELPKFQKKLKNKRTPSDENTNSARSQQRCELSDVEYGYDTQQDELEVKQQFSRYVDQDVYFS